jgi:glycine/D-amino acid oxidase-like deaminating enzyme/nitrite reductase/ring-hydroxylating ferredoxin subunit
MIRDGAHLSLWQATVQTYKPIYESIHSQKFDVIIVGGGITGIATALSLQTAGKKCLVLESENLCYGTTGGTTAHINTLLDTPYSDIIKKFDLDTAKYIYLSTLDAIRKIKSTINSYSIDCGFSECKAYLFAQDKDQVDELDRLFEACEQVGLTPKYNFDTPIHIECLKAMAVPGQAKFHPVQYVYGMADAFEKAGGIILENCRALNINEKEEVIHVETEKDAFQCDHIVYATHIPPGVNLLHLRCVPYRSYAMAVRLNSNQYPEDLTYDMQDPYHYYRTQVIDGEEYFIVGGKDHKTGHEPNTDICFRNLESHIRTYFDVASVPYSWSSQYYESADGIPYIGVLPGHSKRVLVATGFGGNGITYSHVAADVLNNIILEREDKMIDIFSPSRIKPIAGFKTFAEHNFDVLKQLIGKMLSTHGVNGFADIAPGEGKVVRVDNHPVGVYKDEHGSIHTVNASCTHMKCIVSWNISEKSWDCPCHGARYTMDGKVLNGPSDRDLEYINLELVDFKK